MAPPSSLALLKRKHARYNNRQDDTLDTSAIRPARPKSQAMRQFLDLLGGKRAGSHESEDQDAVVHEPTPKLVIAFADTVNSERLSNLLIWFLFYDFVKLPESPSQWYEAINPMEMRGWIALGQFLAKRLPYGLDLVVLDSVCDRLRLSKSIVHECLVRLADPEKMVWTALATTVRNAHEEDKVEVETLELIATKLQDLRSFTISLKPSPQSQFAAWKTNIIAQITDFLIVVVRPQVAISRGGLQLPTAKSDAEERQLRYIYEAIQQPRPVPLIQYGVFPDPSLALTLFPSLATANGIGFLENQFAQADQASESEGSFSILSLNSEVRFLREHVRNLEAEKRKLVEQNEKLAHEASAAVNQSSLYQRRGLRSPTLLSATNNPYVVPVNAHEDVARDPESTIGAPKDDTPDNGTLSSPCLRPQKTQHRLPPAIKAILESSNAATMLSPASLMAVPAEPLKLSDYQDVFGPLDDGPLPTPRLSDPATSTETPPTTPPPRICRLPRNVCVPDLAALSRTYGFKPICSVPVVQLPRNTGIPDLRAASRFEPDQSITLDSLDPTTSPSASESRRSGTSANGPGSDSFVAELQARQLNFSHVQ